MKFNIYRYNPETDDKPWIQSYELDVPRETMLLEALLQIHRQDPTLGFRKSCREGVCGSDGMNVNGVNRLACVTPLSELKEPVEIRPLPGLAVIRDLIVDMEQFYTMYRAVKPYLVGAEPEPEVERLQTPEQRDRLDGLYECILCGCCSTACPSFWWNPDKFLGPAALLQAARFIEDSRDEATVERLEQLDDAYKLYRCHSIMNCVQVCPKDLNPTRAIGKIKERMVQKKL
jgi:succinate dehydrogenase / fumarate reductase iron-sulfur subunit